MIFLYYFNKTQNNPHAAPLFMFLWAKISNI